ncbi:MAG: aminotransferase class I/II-fold pyridoxal phosphate-dependent enzyme [Pseudoflavonifractor sp.]|nr:aminotransferase class I/II-fold pyridoxal phosphate-dependent enzyme [Alloprevotella sp.]MCM1117097.1 aminotransferase class I/II-fold pyridoxal phosphate-dependent enzyme [Pseudoflavonifractor sp.]
MIDGHGDDLWRYAGKICHNFSTNIHAAFDHRPLMAHLASDSVAIGSYPEPEPVSVERDVALWHGCSPSETMVTNGATEAIYIIASLLPSTSSAIIAPTFSEYGDACRAHGHSISFFHSLDHLPLHADLAWICNPNNPTGTVMPRQTLLRVAAARPSTLFVIDQAYADYTLLPTLTPLDAIQAGNIILLGSLTKRFAVPGLRIGYAIGATPLMARLKARRMPWSVNGLSIKAARYLISRVDEYPIDTATLHSEALRIATAMTEMGIRVWPTDCNFILCELPHGSAAGLKQWLVDSSGILIRDASNFEGLSSRHFRVAAQTSVENDLLISRLRQWLAS